MLEFVNNFFMNKTFGKHAIDSILSFERGFSPEGVGSKKISSLLCIKCDFRRKIMVFQKFFLLKMKSVES